MTRDERTLRLAGAGDAMITGRLVGDVHPGFEELAGHIRSADVSVVNLEVLLHDFEFPPAANGPGTYMRAPRWVADELTDAGFDAFVAATNHAMDYGHGGIRSTMRALEARDIPYAGLGRNLEAARAPCYVNTPAGRIGIVSACATVPTGSEAGPTARGMQGRPGISPLRYEAVYRVPPEAYERLQAFSDHLGFERYKDHASDIGFPIDEDEAGFRWVTVGGDTHPIVREGDEYAVERTPNQSDVEAITRQLRETSRQADWTIASLHYHEGRGPMGTDESVPAFVEAFARECVDAGADAFLGHGSHCLRGIEVYDGVPIFYSLGNFVAQNDLVERLPQEQYDRHDLGLEATPSDVFDSRYTAPDGSERGFPAFRRYYESVVPVCAFDGDGIADVTLYPIDLGLGDPRGSRGRPRLADEETAAVISDRLSRLSEPYGVVLDVDGTVATLSW